MTGPDVDFEIDGPLPRGGMTIEASAGTGKTFALADLATRFLAETDISASELLIVTFTRAATNELRGRVRDRLIEVAEHLGRDMVAAGDDKVIQHLASSDVAIRLGRLRTAITDFDATTIATIHGFATQVRGALGESAHIDPDARFVDESDELIDQTCADVLAAAAASGCPATDLPSLADLRAATARASGRPDIVLEPRSEAQGATAAQVVMRELVDQSVLGLGERLRRSGTLSFDSVLTELCDALTGPRSEAAVAALRSRFKVALIDEFQDTDPVQWRIFRRLFGEAEGTTLVLVGDPKQAIYGFRGGDVATYISAVRDDVVIQRRTMQFNWRSDAAVLRSLDALFAGATFGDPTIRFVPVAAASAVQVRRLHHDDGGPLPALSLRLAVGAGIDRTRGSSEVVVGAAVRAVMGDLAVQVRELLEHGLIPTGSEAEPTRRVRPGDIAVLVNRNDECTAAQETLITQGVPAVVAQGGSVLRSPAAEQMRWLLHAMARPSDGRRVRMYALSWFGGWSAEMVADVTDPQLVTMQEDLRQWSERLATHTVADVLAQIWSTSGVQATVLGGPDGDRNMTDLDHLAELLHGGSVNGRANVAALLAALDRDPDSTGDPDADRDLTARRIESEAEAVQVMTIWTAKGLEFPVVCAPVLWRWTGTKDPVIYVDPVTGVKTFDLAQGSSWPNEDGAKARKEMAAAEMTGERLRLLYVALTRARHQTIVWWANAQHSSKTALARILFARDAEGIDPVTYAGTTVPIPGDDAIVDSLAPLVDASDGTVAVAAVDDQPPPGPRWLGNAAADDPPSLDVAPFTAAPDRSKRRWSFSAITDQAFVTTADPYDVSLGDVGSADEGGVEGTDEELDQERAAFESSGREGPSVQEGRPDPVGGGLAAAPDDSGHGGALTRLPAGAAFGTLVHTVLERTDFRAGHGELAALLGENIDRRLTWAPVDLTPTGEEGSTAEEGRRLLISGLADALHTPLGSLGADQCLGDIGSGNMLREVSFDLRLGEAGRPAVVADIGRLAVDHLPSRDPLVPWATGLATGAIDVTLAGHLTGSIDLILRVDDGGGPKFVVADYKTNALSGRGQMPDARDYHPARLVAAMTEHDYPLQALLYSVALHRYLRWRLDGYQPDTHLGGALYLFLRGMTGPTTPVSDAGQPYGVFGWPLPSALVVALSELLDGRLHAELAW